MKNIKEPKKETKRIVLSVLAVVLTLICFSSCMSSGNGETESTESAFTVTFRDYSGRFLGTKEVKKGDTVTAPDAPAREGYAFTGWSPSLASVTTDTTVTAQYELYPGENIIDVSYELLSENTVRVTYAVVGDVCFAGCDMEIGIPGNLTYGSMETGNGVVANRVGETIYVSVAEAHDITKDYRIAAVTYTFTGNDATFPVGVSGIFDQELCDVAYTVIGSHIILQSP